MKYNIVEKANKNYKISKRIHSVFFEYFGTVIYDGIWVGKDSTIPNIDGIRKDVVDGLKEIGVGAMRWPGGCCADHYHFKNGIGKERFNRIHPIYDKANPVWRNDFGTDEFLRFCELVGADPILTVNTATGTPEEFVDWFEYVNGPTNTKYGKMREENGHKEPYNVKYWGIGNTDENVWHIDYNNPISYAQRYMQFQTALRGYRKDLYFIGLGLSTRHQFPGWVGKALDHITKNQRETAPNALSIHHYLGGQKKGGNEIAGDAVEYSDEAYYGLLDLLERYEHDINLHRTIIREHTPKSSNTKICFDEWGAWHPEATFDNNQNQRQTMRDGIFAALTFHIFYKNCDIVDFAMETQVCNLIQSLFETDGEKIFKTPTFYIMKMFKEHCGEYIIPTLPIDVDERLNVLSTISEDENNITISIINQDLYESKNLDLCFKYNDWQVEKADILNSENVRDYNTFDEPYKIKSSSFNVDNLNSIIIPPHSVVRIVLKRI